MGFSAAKEPIFFAQVAHPSHFYCLELYLSLVPTVAPWQRGASPTIQAPTLPAQEPTGFCICTNNPKLQLLQAVGCPHVYSDVLLWLIRQQVKPGDGTALSATLHKQNPCEYPVLAGNRPNQRKMPGPVSGASAHAVEAHATVSSAEHLPETRLEFSRAEHLIWHLHLDSLEMSTSDLLYPLRWGLTSHRALVYLFLKGSWTISLTFSKLCWCLRQ